MQAEICQMFDVGANISFWKIFYIKPIDSKYKEYITH